MSDAYLDDVIRLMQLHGKKSLTPSELHDLSSAFSRGVDVRPELRDALPDGLERLASLPGLGPKKARTLVAAGIVTLEDLERALESGSLLHMRGFGEKSIQKLLRRVRFCRQHEGCIRFHTIEKEVEALIATMRMRYPLLRIEPVGGYARSLELLKGIDILVDGACEVPEASFPVRVIQAEEPWELCLWKHIGSDAHCLGEPDFSIPPELRETGEERAYVKEYGVGSLLQTLQGAFHMHTQASDGGATLEEMIQQAVSMGLQYIGISDHSPSAHYARGLSEARVMHQREEIAVMRERYAGKIHIFWGIESDIREDGSLDYSDAVLSLFDFVIASIHQRFDMDRDAMTARILRALEHPTTRFLGHPTGRLIMEREGYDFDWYKVFTTAKQHGVAIEMNCQANRLDVSWQQMRKIFPDTQPLVSVNPDAHSAEGLLAIRFGIRMARKALIPASNVINSWPYEQVARWLAR